ncbi:MAG: hypothetical protein R3A13_01400 [Bdellovibrionota bacterium]
MDRKNTLYRSVTKLVPITLILVLASLAILNLEKLKVKSWDHDQKAAYKTYPQEAMSIVCDAFKDDLEEIEKRNLIQKEGEDWGKVHIDKWMRFMVLAKQTPDQIKTRVGSLIENLAFCRAKGGVRLWLLGKKAVESQLKARDESSDFEYIMLSPFNFFLEQIDIYQNYDPETLAGYCEGKAGQVSEWEDSGEIWFRDNFWQHIAVNENLFVGNIETLEERIEDYMTPIAICLAKGPVWVFRGDKKRIAHAKLSPGITVEPSFYIVSKSRKKELLKKAKHNEECSSGKFTYMYTDGLRLVKHDEDYTKLYMDKGWDSVFLEDKEKYVEYIGKCKTKGVYAYFYDAYDGKKLARYDALMGATIFSD